MSTVVIESDIGRGLDAFRPETKLLDGFVPAVTNWLPSNSGSLVRRAGYQRVGGGLPVRVERVTRVGTILTLHFNSALSTAGLTSTPVLVYARAVRFTGSQDKIGPFQTKGAISLFLSYTVAGPNSISVDGGVSAGATDTFYDGLAGVSNDTALVGIEAWVWGIPSSWWVSDPTAARTTWVTGLSPYKTQSRDTPIVGWGANLHYLATQADLGPFAPFVDRARLLPMGTVNGVQVIGPAVYSMAPSPTPTRGYLLSSLGEVGQLPVLSIEWDANTGYTTYVLDATGMTAVGGTIDQILRPGQDYLHIEQSAWAVLEGDHLIVSNDWLTDPTKLRVVCNNTGNAAADAGKDDLFNCGATAGVYTDRVAVSAVSPGVRAYPGDGITFDGVGDPTDLVVTGATPSNIAVSVGGLVDPVALTNGQVIRLTRTTALLPLPAAVLLARGDMVSVSGYTRQFRIKNVVYTNGGAELTTTITALDGVATCTTSAPLPLVVGDVVGMWNAGVLTGAQTVTEVVSSTVFKFAIESLDALSISTGVIQSATIGIDEAIEITTAVTDGDAAGSSVSVTSRWVLATTPDAVQKRSNRTLSTHYSLPEGGIADASLPAQTQIGSALYTTNYLDPVSKFDGAQAYVAGLARWNPLLALDVHQNSSALIINPQPNITVTVDAAGATATAATSADAQLFDAGDVVVVADGSSPRKMETATIKAVDTTTKVLTFTTNLRVNFGASFQLYHQVRLRYYFRYVGRDRNGAVVASAAVASQDTTVSIGPDSTVSMKLALYPVYTTIPFYTVELEIYREEVVGGAGAGSFRRLTVIPVKFSFVNPFPITYPTSGIARPFELYEDSNALGAFGTSGLDPLLVLTSGENVGAGWDGPPRALAAASMNGRLLLGNIQGVPEMYLAVRESPTQVPSTFSGANIHKTRLTFRRNGTDLNNTDGRDVQGYEFVDRTQATRVLSNCHIVGDDTIPNLYYFVDPTGAAPLPNGGDGAWIQATQTRANNQAAGQGMDFSGWFQIVGVPFLGATGRHYPIVFPERNRISIPAASVNVAANTFTTSAPHGLGTGAPVFLLSNSDVPPTATGGNLDRAVQYYVILVTDTEFALARTLPLALAGTRIDLTSQGTGTHIFTAHWAFAAPGTGNEVSRYEVYYSNTQFYIPIVLYSASGGFQLTGTYGVAEYARQTSVLLQLAMQQLAACIRAVHSHTVEWHGLGGLGDTTTVYENAWLTADAGADFPFGTTYIRAPNGDAYTIDVAGSMDGAGRDRLVWYVGDARVPVLSFVPADMSIADSAINRVAHGLQTGQVVRLDTYATLPAPLIAGDRYWAVALSNNQFGFASSAANAAAGTLIPLTTTGSGLVHPEVGAITKLFPSRVVRSYPNYPEIFDSPLSDSASPGSSVIDVNPDDGQQIQAIIPFYADSYTRASQQEARLVVLKERAVYMANTETGEVQQIHSMGHGAEFPRSACSTRAGILFADRTGVYKINAQSEWEYTGQSLGRTWTEGLNTRGVQVDVPVAIHNERDRRAVLALPDSESGTCTRLVQYDYTRESAPAPGAGAEQGAWSVHDDYAVTAFAVHGGVTHHGDVTGLVYQQRIQGDTSDFRDDDRGYTSLVQLRPMDFGQPGSRKRVTGVTIQFRLDQPLEVSSLTVAAAIEGRLEYLPLDSVKIEYVPPTTGISDVQPTRIQSVTFDLPQSKAEYFQLQIEMSRMGEALEITQVAYHVEMLSENGVQQAADTTASRG